MAIVNPSNLYQGNAVVLDSRPSTNLAIQLMAKQQAKRDALNQYYSKLQDATLGEEDKMRPQDIQDDPNGKYKGWGSDLKDWQMFYMNPENKKNILNPNRDGYQTLNKFNAMHTNLIAKARDSKYELAQEKTYHQHLLSGRWNPVEADMHEGDQMSKSIYDQNRMIEDTDPETGMKVLRKPSLSNLSVNYPAWDGNKQVSFDKSVAGNDKPKKVYNEKDARVDKKTMEIYVPFKERFSDDEIKNRVSTVNVNPRSSAGVHYEQQLNELAKDPNALETASQVYQSVYGKADKNGNPNLVDTPQKVAQVEQIMKLRQSGSDGEEKITDKAASMRLASQLGFGKMYAQDKLIRGRMKVSEGLKETFYNFKEAKDSKSQEGILNKFNETSYNSGTTKLNGVDLDGVTIGGTKYQGRFVEVPRDIKKEYTLYKGQKNGVDVWVQPDRFYMTDDKKTIIPIYLGDKTASGGNKILPDSKPQPIQLYKASLAKILLTKKQTGGEVTDDDITDDNGDDETPTHQQKPSTSTPNSLNASEWKKKNKK